MEQGFAEGNGSWLPRPALTEGGAAAQLRICGRADDKRLQLRAKALLLFRGVGPTVCGSLTSQAGIEPAPRVQSLNHPLFSFFYRRH